jgi:hypothetical protein
MRVTLCWRILLMTGFLFLFSRNSSATTPEQKQVLRWSEGTPGSAFAANPDGTYRYGLAANDVSVTLAVDSLELDKTRRRIEPLLAIFLTLHYSGSSALELDTRKITLEFVDHFHDRRPAIDPGELARRLKLESAAFSQKTEREIAQHPQKKAELEAALADHNQALRAMVDFLGVKALRSATANPERQQMSGWVFFATRSKWVGELSKQEDFVLRVPVGTLVIEFPFTLPPSQSDINLRTRPEE